MVPKTKNARGVKHAQSQGGTANASLRLARPTSYFAQQPFRARGSQAAAGNFVIARWRLYQINKGRGVG
jgi:hypothetical protein